MNTLLQAITLFGQEIRWTNNTVLTYILVTLIELAVIALLIFIVVVVRVKKPVKTVEAQDEKPVTLTVTENMPLTLSVPENPSRKNEKDSYDWYVNGELLKEVKGRTYSFPKGLAVGNHFVQIQLEGKNVSLMLVVVQPAPKEEKVVPPVVNPEPAAKPVAEPEKIVRVEKYPPIQDIIVPKEEPKVEKEAEKEAAPAIAEVAPPVILDEDELRIRYDRSFTARLLQSDEGVKQWYEELRNELLSYQNIKARTSWKRETFRVSGRDVVNTREVASRLSFRGKTLCLFLPIDPNELIGTKYKVDDASDTVTFADTPCLYRIKNDRRLKYAKELIKAVMDDLGIERGEEYTETYDLPYKETELLLEEGLIKLNSKTKADEAIFETSVAQSNKTESK